MTRALTLVFVAIIAYLLGSLSTGLIISASAKVDIRKLGSRSTGATNVTRVMGLGHGLLTFLGDAGKAALAVLIGRWMAGTEGGLLAGLLAIIGHNWPVYYQWKGGKGVACSVAVLLLNTPLEGAIACGVALLTIAVTRYVSLGSLLLLATAAALLPFSRGMWPHGAWALALLLIGAYRHRQNIARLVRGEENKFTGGRQKTEQPQSNDLEDSQG